MSNPIRDLLTAVRGYVPLLYREGFVVAGTRLSHLVGEAEAYEARRENDRRNLREELRELAARLGPQEGT